MSSDTRAKLPSYLVQFLVVGLLGWIGLTVQDTSVKLARLDQAMIAGTERDQANARDILELRARVATCEIALAQLRR